MKSTRKIILLQILTIFFLLENKVLAQTTYTLTLNEAIEYGLNNNLSIRSANYDQQLAKEKIAEIKSGALPQITAEGQFQNFPNLPTQILPGELIGQPGSDVEVQFGTEYNASGTLKATQLIYSQELNTGLKAAKESKEFYELKKKASEEDVIYEVSIAFYNVLRLQSQVAVLDSNLLMLNKLKTLTRAKYENDLVTKIDYSRVSVNLANLETQLLNIQASLDQQKNYLKLILGMPISYDLEVTEPEQLNKLSIKTSENGQNNHIQLELLKKQEALTSLNKKAIQAGYYPTLSLFGQQSWQAQRNEFNFFDGNQPWFQQTLWGVQLSIPIFDGFKKHRKVQQVKLELEQIGIQKLSLERQLKMQSLNAESQLTNSLKAIKAQEQNKELAKEVYDQTKLLYNEQVGGLTELLDAEQAYRNAQTNYYNELIKFKVSELDLLKTNGKLTSILSQP